MTIQTVEHQIETRVHGRYLVQGPASGAPLLVGFHGYGETADIQLTRMLAIPGTERWLCCAIQALHPFYGKSSAIAASWMTRQNRDLAISDNIFYVNAVIDQVIAEYQTSRTTVVLGFSQGSPMAYRLANSRAGLSGMVILGGDMADELLGKDLRALPPLLLCRGLSDPYIAAETEERDIAALTQGGARFEKFSFPGGHEWSPEFNTAAGAFLTRYLA